MTKKVSGHYRLDNKNKLTLSILSFLVIVLAVLGFSINSKINLRPNAAYYNCTSLGGFCTSSVNCPFRKRIIIACKGNQVCCRPSAPTPQAGPTTPPTNQAINILLFPVANFTPKGRGNVSFVVTKNQNGYWDFLIKNATFSNFEPGRTYQLHLCGSNGCSSHSGAKFVTDGLGNGSFANITINHNQWNNSVNRAVIYEYLSPGSVPTDPKSCPMVGLDSVPCLKGGFVL